MRIISSLRNAFTTVIPYMIITYLGFCKTRGFIVNLGEDIYSINQVFYQIFIYLSLTESGIGIVAFQKYYQLLIKNQTDQINAIYSASKKVLRKVAFIILTLGIALSFSLKMITKNDLSLGYLQIVFVLFLLRNLVDYFMFSPRFIIQADQKAYKINWWINVFRILELVIEIQLIYSQFNYIIILIPSILVRICMNLVINKVVHREYPWLKEVKDVNTSLLSGTKDFFVQKISNVVYSNTDVLVISTFLNSTAVVIYSSYYYIVTALNEIITIITESITPSLGNAIHKEKLETSYAIFEEQNSLFAFLSMFFTGCMLILIRSFVILWIGADKVLDIITLLCIGISFFYSIYSRVILNTINIKGWFKETKKAFIIEAVLNVSLSILFVNWIGIQGVVLATILSTFFTKFLYLTIYVYQNLFHQKAYHYYYQFLTDLMVILLLAKVFSNVLRSFSVATFWQWGIMAIVVGALIFLCCFLYKVATSYAFRNMIHKIIYALKEKNKSHF